MTPELGRLVRGAFDGGVDVSLSELADAINWPAHDVLGGVIEVGRVLETFELTLSPPITTGDVSTRRALTKKSVVTAPELQALVDADEHIRAEFKSTLVCDINAYRESPQRLVRSDGVAHSTLKTICAFTNSKGGRLLIGVENDGAVCGLEPDFRLLAFNRDKWELFFRDLIRDSFFQGNAVNSFVAIQYCESSGKLVAVVDVTARSEITYVKNYKDKRLECYVRQGNRTVALDLPSFESLVRDRVKEGR